MNYRLFSVVAGLAVLSANAQAEPFTYQGQLIENGAPASGLCDLQFTLYDSRGSVVAGPIDVDDEPVSNGLFNVVLDFGADPFNGEARFLEIGVRPGASFDRHEVLSPRQELTPTPYATMAMQTVGVDGHSLDGADGGPIDAVYVDVIGHVGVGTDRPSAELDVNGRGKMLSLQLGTTATPGHVLTADADGVGSWQAPPAGGDSLWSPNRNDIYFSAGNVGIGTASPATHLDVAGGIAVDAFQMGDRVPAGHVLTADANGVGTWQAPPSTSDPVWAQSAGAIYYDDGDVGIGTTSPTEPLHVVAASGSAILGHADSEADTISYGVQGITDSVGGYGVRGEATGWSGAGVHGYASSTGTGTKYGVQGVAEGPYGRGVHGEATGESAFAGYFEGRGYFSDAVGIGTTAPNHPLHVTTDSGSAIVGQTTDPSLLTAHDGVYGEATGINGTGVHGLTTGDFGRGVFGEVTGLAGHGVSGQAEGGIGVYGTSASSAGVFGNVNNPGGIGVHGKNLADTGDAIGVYGETSSPTGYAGYFDGNGYFSGKLSIGFSPPLAQVHIENLDDTTDAFRVDDEPGDTTPFVVDSNGNVGIGVSPVQARAHIVNTDFTSDAFRVDRYAGDTSPFMINGDGDVGIGTDTPVGKVQIAHWNMRAHFMRTSLHPDGKYHRSIVGVYDGPEGVAYGQLGYRDERCLACNDYYYGVRGVAEATSTNKNFGVYGSASGGILNYAGWFDGDTIVSEDLDVTGNLSKGGGSFKIDHPLDPQNKYLRHSFVESPDMMNVYNGNVVLGKSGEARVTLPDYFEALNRDFRYQLTAIGAPGPNLYIAEKITKNTFKIAGGKPGMEVSWQVTGIRQDAWANANRIQVESEKPERVRGAYLHPTLFGSDAESEADRLGPPVEREY